MVNYLDMQIPLPKGWPKYAKAALVQAAGMVHEALTHVRGWAANSMNKRLKLQVQLEVVRGELALLRRIVNIKDKRFGRIRPKERPHYPPTGRQEILEIGAAQGWSVQKTADVFLVDRQSIRSRRKESLNGDAGRLLRTAEPVNRFDDETREAVRMLKTNCAVGKHGSIAVIERFIRSLKDEWTRRIDIPLESVQFQAMLNLYQYWFNEHRPHEYLGNRTPSEVYQEADTPAIEAPRYEPRERYPIASPCASPQVPVRGSPGAKLQFCVSFLDEGNLLPILEIREVA